MGAGQGKLQSSYVVGSADPTTTTNGDIDKHFSNIPECIRYYATSRPEEEALVFCSTVAPREVILFKELYERSLKMANALKMLSIKAGETVVIISRTCPEWFYTVIGAMMIGAYSVTTIVTYNDGHDVIQLMKTLGNSSCLVVDAGPNDSNWNILKTLLDDYDSNGHVSSSHMPYLRDLIFTRLPTGEKLKQVANLIEENDQLPDIQKIDPDELAVFFQTSGSTGEPKLVAHSHNSLLQIRATYKASGIFQEKKIFFNDRPHFWLSGFMWEPLVGYKRVTISGMCPIPEDNSKFVIDVIQSERCTDAFMLPPTIYELMKKKKDIPSDWSLANLVTGGQPSTKTIADCVGTICKRLAVVYGASEMMLVAGVKVENADQYVDYACGRIPEGVIVKVCDENGMVVPIGERGEIYVKSDWMFTEYYNNPEKTAAVKTQDGWYKSDDYGRVNTDGFLFVEGRISDIILSGGKNVAPALLEAVLKSYPGVEEAAIVPIPDNVLFQAICACVKVKSGYKVTEADLKAFVEKTHMDQQDLFTGLPKYYMILDTFPEERTGKVSRKTLKQIAVDMIHTK